MRPLIFVLALVFTACEVANPAYDTVNSDVSDADAPDPDDALFIEGGRGGLAAGGRGGLAAGGQGGLAGLPGDAGTTTATGGNKGMGTDAASPTDTLVTSAPDAGIDAGPQLASGPILEFLFKEGSGTRLNDTSGYGNHGQAKCVSTCSNGLPGWIRYENSSGLELAYYQMVQVNASPSLNAVTGDFSLVVHLRRIDHPGIRPVASSLASDRRSTLFLFSFDDGHLSARVGGVRVADPQTAPAHTWMHIGVRRQAGTLSLFRDGRLVASASQSTVPLSTTEPLLIGAAFLNEPFNQTYADAVIDVLALYDRALSNSDFERLR